MIYILIVSCVPYLLSLFLCEFSSLSAVAIIIFSLTPLILPWSVLRKTSNQWKVYRKTLPKCLNWLIRLGVLSALINIGLCASAGGFDITSANVFQSVSEAGSFNAVKRYLDGTEPSNSFLMMLTFNALILSSVYGKVLKSIALVICLGVYTILTLAKWPLYVAISIMASGYISTSPSCGFFIQVCRPKNKFQKAKAFFYVIIITIVITVVLSLAIFLRTDMQTFELSEIAENVKSYSLNQYCNYSYWYEKIYNPSAAPNFQSYFAGPVSLLGGVRIQGIYEQTITMNESDSNIFTVSRGLIEAFTLLGPLIFSSLAAILITFLRMRNMLKILVIILNMTLISCFLGINVSIFKDNSVWVSVITSAIILIRFPPLLSSTK